VAPEENSAVYLKGLEGETRKRSSVRTWGGDRASGRDYQGGQKHKNGRHEVSRVEGKRNRPSTLLTKEKPCSGRGRSTTSTREGRGAQKDRADHLKPSQEGKRMAVRENPCGAFLKWKQQSKQEGKEITGRGRGTKKAAREV